LVDDYAVGGNVGMTVAKFVGANASGEVEPFNRMGLAVGVGINLGLSRFVALQADILFVQKGSNYETDGEDRGSIHLEYLEFPLLARVRLPVSQRATPYMLVGPGFSYTITAEARGANGGSRDLKEETRSIDLGLIVGVGTALQIVQQSELVVEARYEMGLVSIDDSGDGGEVYNRAFTFLVGYQYRFGQAPARSGTE
jgi:opacity protein-like surface antigen